MPLHHVTRPTGGEREVIACLCDRVSLARLQDALPEGAILKCSRSAAELDRMLRVAGDRLRLVVVSPRDDAGSRTAAVVAAFRRRRPDVTLVGYCRATQEHSRDIIDLAAAGIHEVIFRDTTDWGEMLRQTLARAGQNCGASQIIDRLTPVIPIELRPLVEYCLYFPHLATSVSRVAAALGVHRKTLVNYSARYGHLAPSAMIVWCRLLVVGYLLETRGESVERIALALEFPSATALRNSLRRHTGYRPADLRRDGWTCLLDAFTAALSRAGTHPRPDALRAG